jgi:hypothetical protein
MPSERRPLGKQVAHRSRLAAEEVAEERAGAREQSLAGGEEEPQHQPGHGLRGAVRDPVGYSFLVVDDDAPDVAAGDLGGDPRDVAERHGGARGERDRAVEMPLAGQDHRGRLGLVSALGP